MRNLEEHPGIKVGGKNVNNLRYADDTVWIAENEKELQALLDIIARESLNKGLELNGKKKEVMVICRKANPTYNTFVKGTKLRKRETFRYLSALITQDGRKIVGAEDKKATSNIFRPCNEKGGFGTFSHHWQTRQEKMHGKTNRKNAEQPEVLVGCWKSDGYDVGSSRLRHLERHDRQRHEAGHLMMMTQNNFEKKIIKKYYHS